MLKTGFCEKKEFRGESLAFESGSLLSYLNVSGQFGDLRER